MPRRNLRWMIAVTALSWICYLYVPTSRYSRVLADNMDRIARQYYRPVNELELFEGAMSGMTQRLDKHSEYFSAGKKETEFSNDLNKEFVGIGVIPAVDPATKQLLVVRLLPDGPAVAAGVRVGDRIERIDGKPTQGMPLADAIARIQGKPDTPVAITVRHRGVERSDDLTMVRRVVHKDTVLGATQGPDGRWSFLLPGHPRIGYVYIKDFVDADDSEKSTAPDLHAALEQLRKDDVRGLVLDLRDDPGGALAAAIEVCDMFVPRGEIVTTRGRDHQVLRVIRASGKAAFTDLPIAVLVNGSSASASEIVAACLQDNGRAVVVGQRSYGKGTVQQVFDLGDPFGKLKLTVATYWRPSGKDINRPKEDNKNIPWGVSPDEGYEVLVTDVERQRLLNNQSERETAAAAGVDPPSSMPDRVLQKAVDYLESKER